MTMTLPTLQETYRFTPLFTPVTSLKTLSLTGATLRINLIILVGPKNVRKSGKFLRTENGHGHFYYMFRILIRTYNENFFDVFLFVIV